MKPAKTRRIYIATIAANISAFSVGTSLGWTSPVGLKLKDENLVDSPLDHVISTEDDGWISSTLALGALVAPYVAGPLADKIGRKLTLLCSSICFIAAYILMMVASEVWTLILGRIMQGCGVAFVMTVLPMYVGEIATDAVRGVAGTLFQLFLVSGILYVFAIGPYVSYMTLQWCCIAVPIVFVFVFFFMPESPYYYAVKGQKTDALKSLQFFRGQSADDVHDEMSKIQHEVDEAMANKRTIFDVFQNAGNRRALIICVGLITLQQLAGINAILFNSQSIFESAQIGLDSAISSIIIAVMQVVTAIFAPLIAKYLGRKTILLISTFGMTVGLTALGAFFYVQEVIGDASNITWLPLPAVVLFYITFCTGLSPMPWVVLGEMFPGNCKAIAASIVASSCWIVGFAVARWYPALDELGSYYAFWLFATFCGLGVFFTIFVVMETKGMSLQEIQDKLHYKKPN